MIKSILAIINPISGYARQRGLAGELRAKLTREGFDTDFHFTTGPHDAYAYTRANVSSFDLVLVAGGDGTVRDVISAAAPSGVPATVFPTGTENVFAKEMDIAADFDRLIQAIKWGKVVAIDMGMVNGKRFLMLSGVGFDARVLLHLASFRSGNITHLTYFWPIWRTFWEYDFPPVTVEADGETVVDGIRGLVFVMNISRYAVGLRICQRARHDDGLLDLCIYRCQHQVPLLRHAWRTMLKRHLDHEDVLYRQAKNIKITSCRPLPYQIDGDPAGYLPAEYSILPSEVKILVPPGR